MAIEFVCRCGKAFTVGDEKAGKKGRCSSCGELIEIPNRGLSLPGLVMVGEPAGRIAETSRKPSGGSGCAAMMAATAMYAFIVFATLALPPPAALAQGAGLAGGVFSVLVFADPIIASALIWFRRRLSSRGWTIVAALSVVGYLVGAGAGAMMDAEGPMRLEVRLARVAGLTCLGLLPPALLTSGVRARDR